MKCNHYLRVLRFILKFLKFRDSPIFLPKDLSFNSFKVEVRNNSVKKTCRHIKNYIPIPFSVLRDRRAGTRPAQAYAQGNNSNPSQCTAKGLQICLLSNTTLHFKISISPTDPWDGLSSVLTVRAQTICTLQKVPTHRETKKLLMPFLIRQMFSPFLFTSHTVKCYFAVKASKY